ncbi:MAG: hypothetical protein JSV81_23135 [Anaerolineales bacterium]|nr:MAG: hypothetical protein JSV81_23135 [Anaerolineales bacterium]
MSLQATTMQAEGSVLIASPIGTVFEFVCDAGVTAEAITPLEDHIVSQGRLGLGWAGQVEVEIAARVVRCQYRCTEFEPPTRLVLEIEGDVPGKQMFTLAEELGHTRLNMSFGCVVPPGAPAYFREEPTRSRFAQTLVSQTLSNIQAALEVGLPPHP